MSEMVERVARILEPQAWAALGLCDTIAYQNRRTSSLRKARAAIQAMRKPTPDMYVAAYAANGGKWTDDEFEPPPNVCWPAMTDAALTPDPHPRSA
jgi:hypothetical protein